MEDLLKTFIIPDNTTMEEHSIVTTGGVIIGNHTNIGFGIIADSVIAGERVRIKGSVIGTNEVRIDMWSQVNGDVRTKNDAYIGEFVNIDGKLIVGKDLDIGKDVKINGGYETRGWIVVRNPIPVIIYIFLYLTELLRMGKDEEVDNALKNLFSDEHDDFEEDKLLIIPSGSKIDLESIKVPNKAVIGSGCRMMGNIRASSILMGADNTLFGSIKTTNEIIIGERNTIHGNLVTRGEVHVSRDSHILGEINAQKIIIHEEARVDGAMRAARGVKITRNIMEEELKTSGLLDMVPKPATSKKNKAVSDKKKKDDTVVGKPVDKTITTTSKTRASKAISYNIPAKRMTTAIRLGDIITHAPVNKHTKTSTSAVEKEIANRTTDGKKETAEKKTDDDKEIAEKKKNTIDKLVTDNKKKPIKTEANKKTNTKNATDKVKASTVKSSTGKTTTKKKKNTIKNTDSKKKPAVKKKTTKKTTKKS